MLEQEKTSPAKKPNLVIKATKRFKVINSKIDKTRAYDIAEALTLLREECPPAKFLESVDVSIRLGVDPRKSDQVVRGATVLPHGLGREVRVAVFAEEGEAADAARKAGADIVGFDDLLQSVKDGNMNFDVVIATPSAMRVVGQLGQILGPRGLMPNPKLGTVTQDTANAVRNAKMGQVRYRTEKAGIVHCSIGRINFENNALIENLEALIHDIRKMKPESSKGTYFRKLVISTTMGPGLVINLASFKV